MHKNTGLGCVDGGMPFCPLIDYNYFCRDGTTVFRNDVLTYIAEDRRGCICPDGVAPRCITDGDLIKCPDGSYPDKSVGQVQEFLKGCTEEAFEVPKEWAPEVFI